MNYLLLAISLLSSQINYGANAAAGDQEHAFAFGVKKQYGGLIALQKFQGDGYEIDLLGEEHSSQTEAAYKEQRVAIERHIEQLRQTQTPHLFLVEQHPTRVDVIDDYRSGPISEVTRLLRKPSSITLSCFDRRPLGLAYIMSFVENIYKAVSAQPASTKIPKANLQLAIAVLYSEFVATSHCKEDVFLKRVACVEQELRTELNEAVASQLIDENTAGYLNQDILELSRFSSTSDAASFIEIQTQIMCAPESEKRTLLNTLTRVARFFGHYCLTKAIRDGMQNYKRITAVTGENHIECIRLMLLSSPSFSLTKSYNFAPTKGVPPALSGEQLRLFFDLPAAPAQPVSAKAEFEGKQAAAQHAASPNSDTLKAQQSVCQACNKILEKKSRCGTCKKVYYCNQTCQIADWPKHKEQCGK